MPSMGHDCAESVREWGVSRDGIVSRLPRAKAIGLPQLTKVFPPDAKFIQIENREEVAR